MIFVCRKFQICSLRWFQEEKRPPFLARTTRSLLKSPLSHPASPQTFNNPSFNSTLSNFASVFSSVLPNPSEVIATMFRQNWSESDPLNCQLILSCQQCYFWSYRTSSDSSWCGRSLNAAAMIDFTIFERRAACQITEISRPPTWLTVDVTLELEEKSYPYIGDAYLRTAPFEISNRKMATMGGPWFSDSATCSTEFPLKECSKKLGYKIVSTFELT